MCARGQEQSDKAANTIDNAAAIIAANMPCTTPRGQQMRKVPDVKTAASDLS